MLRPDYIFSYWVVFWYILYELSITKYNPKVWLIIALGFNLINMMTMIYYKNYYLLSLFILVVLLLKVIPIWTLRNTKITRKDFLFGIVLFIIYNFWLLYNNYSYYKIFLLMYDNSKKGTLNNSPLMRFINKLI
jgi:hypothetical protein